LAKKELDMTATAIEVATVYMGYHNCLQSELPRVLQGLLPEQKFYAWLEDSSLQVDPHGLCLRDDVTHSEALTLPTQWPEGRLFNAAIDLRWEQQPGGRIHLVVIGETLPASFAQPAPLELNIIPPPNNEPEHLLLWGERTSTQKSWTEGRIPQLERFYPKHWSGRWAALQIIRYEALWEYDPEMPAAARIVTRYLRYVGEYRAPIDPRFP
jgi:hypothetical protein